MRAARKQQCHQVLLNALSEKLQVAEQVPQHLRQQLTRQLDRVISFTGQVAAAAGREQLARQAASTLYYVTAAVLMACEGAGLAARDSDSRRLLWSQLLIEQKLLARDPLAAVTASSHETDITTVLLETAMPFFNVTNHR
jgi:site-specific recombinase XerC